MGRRRKLGHYYPYEVDCLVNMRLITVLLAAALAMLLSGCAATVSQNQKDDAAPPALEQGEEAAAVEVTKPSEEEISARVAEELEQLGEKDAAKAEEEEAAGGEEVTYDIPITINAQVERWIDYFQTRIPKRFKMWLARSGAFIPIMRPILKDHGLPEDLVYLALIESGFSCRAYSRAHACGPWQFIRGTGRRYGLTINYWVDERRDPIKATHAAAKYLRDLYDEFGSWYLAAAGYNAGEGKIRRALARYKADTFWDISQSRRRYLRRETKNYVPKMIAAAIIAKEPEKYGFTDIEYESVFSYDEVRIHPGTSLGVAAKLADVKVGELHDLNPELRRWCTPPNSGMYTLRVPAGRKAAFEAAYAKLSPKDRKARIGAITVRINRGDTLGRIARVHGVPLRDLMALNPHLSPRRLQIGQRVHVPPTAKAQRLASRSPRTYPPLRRNAHKMTLTVRRGDSLWHIAQAYNLNHRQIMRWNGLRSSRIQPGQKLVLYVPQAKAAAKVPDSSPTPARAGTRLVYVVKRGDTLWDIARAYGVSHHDIKRWNGKRSSRLSVGQRLVIMAPGRGDSSSSGGASQKVVYLVRRGDTLWDISRRFNVTTRQLKRWNNLTNSYITPGDRLTVRTVRPDNS